MYPVSFVQPVKFYAGRIGLTRRQAEPRKRMLDPVGGGVYKIVGPIEFKAGEVILLDEIPKALWALRAPGSPAAPKDAAETAEIQKRR